jgi:hypothetical protein
MSWLANKKRASRHASLTACSTRFILHTTLSAQSKVCLLRSELTAPGMVFERLQRLWRRDESGLGFDNPNAYRSGEDADCLSCRVVGTDYYSEETDLR